MKRRFVAIIGLSLCILISCIAYMLVGSSSKYVSYISQISNSGMGEKVEKEFWDSSHVVDETIEKKKRIMFGAEEFSAEYQHSEYDSWSRSRTDTYHAKEIIICLRSDDGFLEAFYDSRIYNDEYYARKDIENSYEYAKEMANEIASQYINIEEYQLKETSSLVSLKEDKSYDFMKYKFEFIKYIDGIRTAAKVHIIITSKGDLIALSVKNVDDFDNVDTSNVDFDEVEKSIKNKLNEVYLEKLGMKSYSYNIESQTLAYAPEGQLILASIVDVHIVVGNGNDYNTLVEIATVIEEPAGL